MNAGITDILRELEGADESLTVVGLHGGAKSLLTGKLAHLNPQKAILIITSTAERAQEFIEDCKVLWHPDDIGRLALFPESSALPFSRLSPEGDDWAERIEILHKLSSKEPIVVVAPVGGVMRRTPPKNFITDHARILRVGEEIDADDLIGELVDSGYEDVGLVEDMGAFARRGGIVDVWSPTTEQPVRLELDFDRITSMRYFDPANQRSKREVLELTLLPARDIPFDRESRMKAAHRIRERALDSEIEAKQRRQIIEYIHEGMAFAGLETLMPIFHEKTSTLFDYLPEDACVIYDETADVESAALAHEMEVSELAANTEGPERIIAHEEIELTSDEIGEIASKFQGMRFNAPPFETDTSATTPTDAGTEGNRDLRLLVTGHADGEDMLAPLVKRIKDWSDEGNHIVITCHTQVQADRLHDLFKWHETELIPFDGPFESISEMASTAIRLRVGRISAGFRWVSERLVVISDEEIFGSKARRRTSVARPLEPFTSFAELSEGDYLVHEQHGIARYAGLIHMTVDQIPADYLLLEYLGGDKLYLPVWRLNLVGRYIGSGDGAPMLNRLGGTRWSKLQTKVTKEIRLMAKELLDIHAARKIFPGHSFADGGPEEEEFAAAFPFDETPDQDRAIEDIMRGMAEPRPMDRLICGDVGYGKTEVAMRAAFRAVAGGKQVAILVPTTILALQHYESFLKRFEDTPMSIEMLSRFRSAKEKKPIIEGLNKGTIDIIIGTHSLLQKDFSLRNLGLLIIDEEHRFGVKHKERIKKLRSNVDVITLSATPIPRTLNLSLVGIRDISIINTPPSDRQSISTYVTPFEDVTVRQAIKKEIARGGQVFFVHNRVETISSMFDRLRRLVPEARIVVGHGQMKERELEKVMVDFIEGRSDVLLCTTIIESGLDIPRANTIIVHRADCFGLAQLYQLRGRVGRSNAKAFAYLLTPPEGTMTPLAKKRLMVLKRFTALGSGFQIAMHDLEFRGTGNILGSAQSGHITAVGYELFSKLLDRAVRKLKGKEIEAEVDPEINLKVAAFLPENYIPDPGTRIDFYRRLASRETSEEIEILGEELIDRFGPLPIEAMHLLDVMLVKQLARSLRFIQLNFDGVHFSCQIDKSTPLGIEGLLELATARPTRYRLVPQDKLLITADETGSDSDVLHSAKKSLSHLLAYVSEKA
jgi:transcription-repair coupling factor (superfamily II helicase)